MCDRLWGLGLPYHLIHLTQITMAWVHYTNTPTHTHTHTHTQTHLKPRLPYFHPSPLSTVEPYLSLFLPINISFTVLISLHLTLPHTHTHSLSPSSLSLLSLSLPSSRWLFTELSTAPLPPRSPGSFPDTPVTPRSNRGTYPHGEMSGTLGGERRKKEEQEKKQEQKKTTF